MNQSPQARLDVELDPGAYGRDYLCVAKDEAACRPNFTIGNREDDAWDGNGCAPHLRSRGGLVFLSLMMGIGIKIGGKNDCLLCTDGVFLWTD